HGRLDFLAESGTRLKKPREPIENLGQQTAMLARFNHADKKPIKYARMLGNRLIKCIAALNPGRDVTNDKAQIALAFRIALFVKSGQRLHERDTGFDHGGQLAGEEDDIGLFDRAALLALAADVGL